MKKKDFIKPIREKILELGEFSKNSHCVEHSRRRKLSPLCIICNFLKQRVAIILKKRKMRCEFNRQIWEYLTLDYQLAQALEIEKVASALAWESEKVRKSENVNKKLCFIISEPRSIRQSRRVSEKKSKIYSSDFN